MTLGRGLMILAAPLAVIHEYPGAVTLLAGGWAIRRVCRLQRRRHRSQVWAMASATDDPIEALAMYEYLYRLRFTDLCALAEWRRARERAGLPVVMDDPSAPRQVREMARHLHDAPREA